MSLEQSVFEEVASPDVGLEQEEQLLFKRLQLLWNALDHHWMKCRKGVWTPALDEELWSVLPGEPIRFPFASMPEEGEFREQCFQHQQKSFLIPLEEQPPMPYQEGRDIFRCDAIMNSHDFKERQKKQQSQMLVASFDIPDFPVPDLYDGRLQEGKTELLRAHCAYLETIIRWHASHAGHDLCWEHNAVLQHLAARLRGFEFSPRKPKKDKCLHFCKKYHAAIADALAQRDESSQTTDDSELLQINTDQLQPEEMVVGHA